MQKKSIVVAAAGISLLGGCALPSDDLTVSTDEYALEVDDNGVTQGELEAAELYALAFHASSPPVENGGGWTMRRCALAAQTYLCAYAYDKKDKYPPVILRA